MKSALVQRTPSSPAGSARATMTNDKNYWEPFEFGSLAEAISRDHVGDGDIDSGERRQPVM
jgi:hypothetical protein